MTSGQFGAGGHVRISFYLHPARILLSFVFSIVVILTGVEYAITGFSFHSG